MNLQFKSKTYNFKTKEYIIEPEIERRTSTVDNLIFAFDTESVNISDKKYEPICFQISAPERGEYLQYLKRDEKAIQSFLEYFDLYFGDMVLASKTKSCFMYGHNIEYDFQQLVKKYPAIIQMVKNTIGLPASDDKEYKKELHKQKKIDGYEIFNNGEFSAILEHSGLFRGNAPFFTIQVYYNKQVNYTIRFRDTWSFFPGALSVLGEELNLDECKKERPENLGDIDYRELPVDDAKRIEFELYGKVDAKVTRLVAERIRELHKAENLFKIRVSGPSYAISILMHSLPAGIKIENGVRDIGIMQLILDSYAGGRSGGVHHGAVFNMFVLDIHSSYPTSFCSLPSFNENMIYYDYPNCDNITMDELLDIMNTFHCFMRIDGIESNAKYPSLIHSDNGKLYPIYGAFENIATTGVEAYVGIKTGGLKITHVHKLVVLIDEDNAPLPFRMFAQSAYKRKQNSVKGSTEYISAKHELTDSYGKLIETLRESFMYNPDEDFVVPYIPEQEKKFAEIYYEKYISYLDILDPDSEKNIDFINYLGPTIEDIVNNFSEEELQLQTLSNFSLTDKHFGNYAIPAAASLTTATSRARLFAGIIILNALYWDTDSLFCTQKYDEDKINGILEKSKDILPSFVQPLKIGDELGDLDAEVKDAFGYLAGTKRYILENQIHHDCINRKCKACKATYPDKFKNCVVKMAIHGMPSADKREADDLLKKLATGENASYEGKARPLKAKEAKSADRIGQFIRKEYTSIFELDDRLNWTETKNGWSGTIKEFKEVL